MNPPFLRGFSLLKSSTLSWSLIMNEYEYHLNKAKSTSTGTINSTIFRKKSLPEHKKRKGRKPKYDHQKLSTMPYNEYLKTPWWKSKRRKIIRRAKGCCEQCRIKTNWFQVHHLTYKRRGKEWNKDLIALCAKCHQKEHGVGRYDPNNSNLEELHKIFANE